MAKIPYHTRLEPELLDSIKAMAKEHKRPINNMIEILLECGIQYIHEKTTDPKLMVLNKRQDISIENITKAVS